MTNDRYVLRPRDREEISRLKLQHQVWKEETDTVIARAGFKKNESLLDLGCGPGFLSLDLAELVGAGGSVLAVDNSEHFIHHLREEARTRNRPCVHSEIADLLKYEPEADSMDGAICRWVLMFVSDPGRVVATAARALRPGAGFAVMEYAQFKSMSLWPKGESFRKVYDAVFEMIARSGGDADIGGRVPELLERAGFEIVEIRPIWRVGRPKSLLWKWLEANHENHRRLVEEDLIAASELEAYYREWQESSSRPGSFFTAPPLLATLARKREA